MSETKKWYWAYTNDPITWIFDSIEEARDHAIEIEECYFTNEKKEVVHVTTHTNGHYYSDGTVSCEGCHEGNR
jgi:hypothetical protein